MTIHQPIVADAGQHAWKMTREDFLLLEANGSFDKYVRSELLDGEIWVVNAIHSRHAGIQAELLGRLYNAMAALGSTLKAYIAPSVDLSDTSLPEPDLVIAEPHHDGFMPLDKVTVMIEVSDYSLRIDLGRKLRIYAEAGVPEYWVVDVNACTIHQMWSPAGEEYASRDEVAFGEAIASKCVEGLTIETSGF